MKFIAVLLPLTACGLAAAVALGDPNSVDKHNRLWKKDTASHANVDVVDKNNRLWKKEANANVVDKHNRLW
ncbi:hypothetical protein VHEMI08495 [[Torrubiella] hemipterigena]|uniref:Uncharacterized protein n=1 Tax=[Torrubiella] hemipterigena TaxID=1531966 RepID=A0A0A1TPT0_9HYPO|nr:hypothetical protein VHEMI08495 [[Torrubiella] hemipterigena]